MIVIAIPCLLRGGTEMQTLNLVKALVDSEYSVKTLCYFEYDENIVMEYQQAGSSVDLIKLQRNISPFKLIGLLKKLFEKYKPEVVHVQYMAPGAIPILAARLAGVKRIFATVHQPWTEEFHGLKAKILLRISAWLTTRFIAVSENAEKTWFGSSNLLNASIPEFSKSKHFTIHNAIDIDQIDKIMLNADFEMLKSGLGLQDKIIIGAVSRLRHEKGIDLLLSAFQLLTPTNDQLRLLIVGSGPDEEQLKEWAKQHELSDKVIFTGNKTWNEAIELMSIMDIVVCPSRFEGFGLTAAEAMACGKPVIANNTGGLSEVLVHEVSGFLTEACNPKILANSIQYMLDNPEILAQMGKAAREETETRFSYNLFADKIRYLYNSI